MYNKTIIGFGFVICRIIHVEVRVISRAEGLTLIILHITKAESNNCLISRKRAELQKFYKRSHIVNLSYLSNAIKKILDKFRFTGTLIYLTTKQVNNMWEEKIF